MLKYTLKIEGMRCGMCEAHINDVVRREIKKASKVSSSAAKAQTTFVVDEPINEEALKKAIAATGYTLEAVSHEDYVKKGLFGFRH